MAQALAKSIAADKPQSLILPGGTSPRALINELSKHNLDWNTLKITTTDERCVDMRDHDHNAGQIRALLTQNGINPNIIPLWQDEYDTLETIEDRLSDFAFPADICVIGMGPDAHIASLFPDIKPLASSVHLHKVRAPKPPPARISLNLETLCTAQRLILLVVGADKLNVLERIKNNQLMETPLAALIKAAGDKLEIHSVKD